MKKTKILFMFIAMVSLAVLSGCGNKLKTDLTGAAYVNETKEGTLTFTSTLQFTSKTEVNLLSKVSAPEFNSLLSMLDSPELDKFLEPIAKAIGKNIEELKELLSFIKEPKPINGYL
ncbi:hypothetical protein DWQ65_09705 [Treponema phagedenis]|uniref:Lipoprotein n=1 Tax=Treponema phagedenis TaxID=162 RepID=A0A0B7GVW9_TREPH|nr:hypothetical protein [Treponema phagedenis]NVP25259.1 hypothetical protein [Treponema phagedenis]QEJ97066.1 hypothetical protein FUT82_03085 [Treponema phagedenis]QEK02069.1 hypothetical protein FUT84_13455 [Treponema phagedenis]QEK02977.1 hypothetical protein FUT83_03560 [Treponema phagedenis]QEK07184.1 hypothetical protein FUT80_10965 [Treponema phagedenis]